MQRWELALGWSCSLQLRCLLLEGKQAHLLDSVPANDGVRHGMIMFGLSLTAAIVLLMFGSVLLADFPAVNSSARSSDLVSVFTSSDWVPFATLFFGWVGAIIGVSSAGPFKTEERSNVTQMRPAA
jgi:hypothetical protein